LQPCISSSCTLIEIQVYLLHFIKLEACKFLIGFSASYMQYLFLTYLFADHLNNCYKGDFINNSFPWEYVCDSYLCLFKTKCWLLSDHIAVDLYVDQENSKLKGDIFFTLHLLMILWNCWLQGIQDIRYLAFICSYRAWTRILQWGEHLIR
jgi:hypothetical protein